MHNYSKKNLTKKKYLNETGVVKANLNRGFFYVLIASFYTCQKG